MHPIFESLEKNDFITFSNLLNEHPEYIKEVDDGWSLLSLAVQYEANDFVSFLLNIMTAEDILNQKPEHPLHIAFENQSSLVNSLIKHEKINLALISKSGDNLLSYATLYNRKDLCPFLLESGNNPFHENNLEQSAVSLAIEYGHEELFDLYTQDLDFSSYYKEDWIKKAIKFNRVDIFRRLHPYSDLSSDELFNIALDFGHVQIASAILDSGDLIPGQSQVTRMIDLMCKKYSSEEDTKASLEIADFLFSIKVPFNRFVNSEGENAWLLSIQNDNIHIFEKLVSTNETVNITDEQQHTPLFYAIEQRNVDFVKSILKKGANPSHLDRNGSTPLIQAVRYGLVDVVQEILKYPNVSINHLNNNEESALSLALHTKRMDIVSALIWRGAEITKNPVRFIEDNSIYQIGISGGYEKVIDNVEEKTIDSFIGLTQLGFKLDQVNKNGDTFLIHFIKHGYLANFKALLKCFFDANQIDKEGNSALMCAMKKDNDEYALSMLWKFRNLDLTYVNSDGENVYDIAAECNSAKRASRLLQYDEELTLENINKILPILALSGDLSVDYPYMEELKPNLTNFSDKHGNSLLALAALGNNVDNFKWLLKNNFYNVEHKNKKDENIFSIIKKLPESEAENFSKLLTPYINQLNKNKR